MTCEKRLRDIRLAHMSADAMMPTSGTGGLTTYDGIASGGTKMQYRRCCDITMVPSTCRKRDGVAVYTQKPLLGVDTELCSLNLFSGQRRHGILLTSRCTYRLLVVYARRAVISMMATTP